MECIKIVRWDVCVLDRPATVLVLFGPRGQKLAISATEFLKDKPKTVPKYLWQKIAPVVKHEAQMSSL